MKPLAGRAHDKAPQRRIKGGVNRSKPCGGGNHRRGRQYRLPSICFPPRYPTHSNAECVLLCAMPLTRFVPRAPANPVARGVACAAIAGACWGSMLLVPALLPDFSPLAITSGRFMLYGLMSLVILLPMLGKLWPRVTRHDMGALLYLGLTGSILYLVLMATGVQWAGMAITTLIIGMVPLSIPLMSRGQANTLPLRQLLGPMLTVCAGIALINAHELLAAEDSGRSVWRVLAGAAAALVALIVWSHYAIRNARYLQSNRFTALEWSSLSGVAVGVLSLVLWPVALWWQDLGHNGNPLPPARWQAFWLVNLTVAILASLLGNWMWNAATRLLPISLSGQLIVFETLFALSYSFIYLQRSPSWLELAAASLMIGGVCWAVRRHRPQAH